MENCEITDVSAEIAAGRLGTFKNILSIRSNHINGSLTAIELTVEGDHMINIASYLVKAYELIRIDGVAYKVVPIADFDKWWNEKPYVVGEYEVAYGKNDCCGLIKLYFRKRIPYTEKMIEEVEASNLKKHEIAWAKTLLNSVYGMRNSVPLITKVIFNPPATIIYWSDRTKTVVKCGDGDYFDREKGFAMAVCKKLYGTNPSGSNYFNEFKKWEAVNDDVEDGKETDDDLFGPVDSALSKVADGLKNAIDSLNKALGNDDKED